METKRSRAWRVGLVALWIVALATVALDAAADCTSPGEFAELTLTAVTIDGSDGDVQTYVADTEPVTLRSSDGEVDLVTDSYYESFEPGVAP